MFFTGIVLKLAVIIIILCGGRSWSRFVWIIQSLMWWVSFCVLSVCFRTVCRMQGVVSDKTFHLKWNNHLQNLSQLFTTIYSSSALADVTLSCRDGTLKAHKLVLSACSPYFEQIFRYVSLCKHLYSHACLVFYKLNIQCFIEIFSSYWIIYNLVIDLVLCCNKINSGFSLETVFSNKMNEKPSELS